MLYWFNEIHDVKTSFFTVSVKFGMPHQPDSGDIYKLFEIMRKNSKLKSDSSRKIVQFTEKQTRENLWHYELDADYQVLN